MANLKMIQFSKKVAGVSLKALLFSICLESFLATGLCAPPTPSWKVDSASSFRAECRIESQGELLLIDSSRPQEAKSGDKSSPAVSRVPLTVNARLRFTETPLDGAEDGKARMAVRLYEVAKAELQVGKGKMSNVLAENHTTIMVERQPDSRAIYCPHDALTSDEHDLLDASFDPALLASLLPEKPVSAGETWSLSLDRWAELLAWEVVTDGEVQLKWAGPHENLQKIEFAGKLSGGVDGVKSEAEVKGHLFYSEEQRRVTWLAVIVKEQRAASQGSPGFETTTRLRTSIEKSDVADANLPDVSVAQEAVGGPHPLRFRSEHSEFEFLYDPAWRIVTDQNDLAVLRYVQRGEAVAQLNLSPLTALPRGQQLSLEGYQAHLRQSLKNSLGDVLEAGEQLNPQGVRILRVVASGMVEEAPLQWQFYHLSNDRGQRASIAITIGADQLERFSNAGEELIASFSFRQPRTQPSSKANQARRSAEDSRGVMK